LSVASLRDRFVWLQSIDTLGTEVAFDTRQIRHSTGAASANKVLQLRNVCHILRTTNMQDVRIGEAVRRREDDRFVSGRGSYIDDIVPPHAAHAVILRSSRAHARITAIDLSAAQAAEGVLLVFSGADWKETGYAPIPTKNAIRKNRNGTPFGEPIHHCLAIDRVRHVGEPVAVVIAETYRQAREASELIAIDYEDLPALTDPALSRQAGQTRIWEDIAGNTCLDFELGNRAATEAAFASAAHTVALDVVNNRVTAVAMEPRGVIASYDAASGSYTLTNSTQNIHSNRDVFARMLKIPADKLRHVAPDVGGGFGVKNCLYAEPALLLHAAGKLGRPVKWIADRSESFQADAHGRDQVSRVELALDAQGVFQALRVSTVGNLGAWCGTMGPFTPTMGTARTQGGPYRFPAMLYESTTVFTNTAQTDPYRGAGRPEASFHIERIVEYAARKLDLDPVELRARNLLPREALPYKTVMGLEIDSGDFPELLRQTLKLSDHAGFAARAAAAKARGRLRGFAVAPYLECTGGDPKEYAAVAFASDGTVELKVGSQSTGMGHETAHAQILADTLGLPIAAIRYVQGDTAATPTGGGHGGSRGMELGGNAVLRAAEAVLVKAGEIAAFLLNSRSDDLKFAEGRFTDAKTHQSATMAEVVKASFEQGRLPHGVAPGALSSSAVFERAKITIPNGCHAAEVEVDPDTGVVEVVGFWAVDDFGRIINPMLADGQVMGGIVQGLGQALLEKVVYEEGSGQLLTASLMDYCLPRADNVPPLEIAYYEGAPTKNNPLGVKGAGEAGCCGAPPAIVNAVLDALKEYRILHIDMPLTPHKVWRAIHESAR